MPTFATRQSRRELRASSRRAKLAPGFPVWGSSITNGLCFLFYDDINLKASGKIVWYPLKNKQLVSQI
jgi:hypothetical protein